MNGTLQSLYAFCLFISLSAASLQCIKMSSGVKKEPSTQMKTNVSQKLPGTTMRKQKSPEIEIMLAHTEGPK
jgi:hypothetical protein